MRAIVATAIVGAAIFASAGASAQQAVPDLFGYQRLKVCPPGYYYRDDGFCLPQGYRYVYLPSGVRYAHRDNIHGYGGGRPIAGPGCPQGCSRYYMISFAELEGRRATVLRRAY